MNKFKIGLLAAIAALPFLSSCEKYFGNKTDLSFIDVPEFQARTIAYVPIQPVLDNFVKPIDVCAGFDQLMYVVDEGSSEIISFDVAGNELARFEVPGIKKVIQDRKLNLLAIGTKDTTIFDVTYSLSTIYRINLGGPNGAYGLQYATITKAISHPFYYKSTFSSVDAQVEITDIAILADNSYYITRQGPNNSTSQLGGPDDAVLVFNNEDKFISPVSVVGALGGTVSDYFKKPSSLASFVQPPQSFALTTRRDFVFASTSNSSALKVQLIRYIETENGASYQIEDLPAGDTAKADAFLYEPNRFSNPVDVAISGDGTNFIFVIDNESDSLYQFSSNGYEGVQPPPGSSSTKYSIASFGGTGTELTQFNNPSAVAYLDKIVYVADSDNGRVLRFRLTTDFD